MYIEEDIMKIKNMFITAFTLCFCLLLSVSAVERSALPQESHPLSQMLDEDAVTFFLNQNAGRNIPVRRTNRNQDSVGNIPVRRTNQNEGSILGNQASGIARFEGNMNRARRVLFPSSSAQRQNRGPGKSLIADTTHRPER